MVFFVFMLGAYETSEFLLGQEFGSSSMLFLVELKYRAEIRLKIAKIVLAISEWQFMSNANCFWNVDVITQPWYRIFCIAYI